MIDFIARALARKANNSIGNIIDGAYAEIYTYNGTTTNTVPSGTTYYKANLFLTNGVSKGCTADYLNNQIVITTPGTYVIEATFSSIIGTSNVVFETALFANDVEVQNIHTKREFVGAGKNFAGNISGIVNISSSTTIDLRARHDYASSIEMTTEFVNLHTYRIGS